MPALQLEIPEDVTDALRLPPAERDRALRTELALALYQRGVLPAGKARKLADMTRWQFDELLGQRRVPRHYEEDDLRDDLDYAAGN